MTSYLLRRPTKKKDTTDALTDDPAQTSFFKAIFLSYGTISVVDSNTGEVLVPEYEVTAESGVEVDSWGQRVGTLPFSCGRPRESPNCPRTVEACRCPQICEAVCDTYSVAVSLNGQQFTGAADNASSFAYYSNWSVHSVES